MVVLLALCGFMGCFAKHEVFKISMPRKRLRRTTLKRFYSLEVPFTPLPSALPFTDHHSRQFYQVCYPTTIAAFLFSQADQVAQTFQNIE
jgi:hypothetical protein